jgi:hypothetical protein
VCSELTPSPPVFASVRCAALRAQHKRTRRELERMKDLAAESSRQLRALARAQRQDGGSR